MLPNVCVHHSLNCFRQHGISCVVCKQGADGQGMSRAVEEKMLPQCKVVFLLQSAMHRHDCEQNWQPAPSGILYTHVFTPFLCLSFNSALPSAIIYEAHHLYCKHPKCWLLPINTSPTRGWLPQSSTSNAFFRSNSLTACKIIYCALLWGCVCVLHKGHDQLHYHPGSRPDAILRCPKCHQLLLNLLLCNPVQLGQKKLENKLTWSHHRVVMPDNSLQIQISFMLLQIYLIQEHLIVPLILLFLTGLTISLSIKSWFQIKLWLGSQEASTAPLFCYMFKLNDIMSLKCYVLTVKQNVWLTICVIIY